MGEEGCDFAVDGASNLWVRGASAHQVVDVSTIENTVFVRNGTSLVLMTPMGFAMCWNARRVMHWRLLALPMLIAWQLWIANVPCTMGHGNGRSCRSVCKTMCLINAVVCNSSPLVIASGGRRQMRVATVLSWPMSSECHGIWI